MFYCFIEPVGKLANKKVLAVLKAMEASRGLQSFESFVKGRAKPAPAGAAPG